MLLTVALMTIAAMAVLPDMIFQMKRDQEQEMIHRGVQYTRAIRIYYRKFGRYPTKLEDLDNTNNLRYLRKHYKDPLTGKDFKLLHFGEPGLQLGGSFGGGTIPGATPAGAAMNGANGSSSFGSSSGSAFGNSFGSSSGSSFGSSFSNSGSSFGNNGNGVNSSGVFSQSSSSFGGNSNGGFGSNSNSQNESTQGTTSFSDATTPQDADAKGEGDSSSGEQQLIASGPIVGVASLSKKKTIRIFNKKSKYNEWQFIYDPTADRGGLITTPYQTPLQNFGGQSLQNGQNGSQSGTNSSPFSNSSGSSFGQGSGQSSFGGSSFGGSSFGQSSGFGSNSNSGGSNSSSSQQQ
ncbi:MAG: hypothetical protein WAK22_13090 [Candidatus Sulfotelmatobacter sp.]